MKKITFMLILIGAIGLFFMEPVYAGILWKYDLYSAKRAAKQATKPVMIDFYTDWCGWCTKLDNETYDNSQVQNLARKFICVKIDGDKQKNLVRQYRVTGYPAIFFLDNNGNVVKKIPGFVDANTLTPIMKSVLKSIKPSVPVKSRSKKKPSVLNTIMKRIMPSKTDSKSAKTERFTLSGILEGKRGKQAIINDNVVGVGGTVDGATVDSISGNSVILNCKGRKIRLDL